MVFDDNKVEKNELKKLSFTSKYHRMTLIFILTIRNKDGKGKSWGNLLTQTSGALLSMKLNTFVVFMPDGVL